MRMCVRTCVHMHIYMRYLRNRYMCTCMHIYTGTYRHIVHVCIMFTSCFPEIHLHTGGGGGGVIDKE